MTRDVAPETAGALQGLQILVTRPAHQAERLCELISAAGGVPMRFPALEILDPEDKQPLLDLADRLEEVDLAVFISANAVNKAMNLILSRRRWPATTRIAAIGTGSARELKKFGTPADVYPGRKFNSEALLSLPELQEVAGKHIAIIRGDGGREHLADELTRRGAQVEYVEAYRRGRPQANVGELLRIWARGEVSAVTVSSPQALHNLFDMIGKLGQQWLRRTPLVVSGERMAALARELGCEKHLLVAGDATDEALLEALLKWRGAAGKP